MKLLRNSHPIHKAGAGFTLLELLLVIGIIALLLGFSISMGIDSYRRYLVYVEEQVLVGVLEKARSRALRNIEGAAHGVCFREPNYIIFRGVSCTLNSPTNEYISANKFITKSSNFDTAFPTIVFSQLAATTTPTHIDLIDEMRTVSIVVNYEGAITH